MDGETINVEEPSPVRVSPYYGIQDGGAYRKVVGSDEEWQHVDLQGRRRVDEGSLICKGQISPHRFIALAIISIP